MKNKIIYFLIPLFLLSTILLLKIIRNKNVSGSDIEFGQLIKEFRENNQEINNRKRPAS